MRRLVPFLCCVLAACLPNKPDGDSATDSADSPAAFDPPTQCDGLSVDDGAAIPHELVLIGYGEAPFEEELLSEGPLVVTDDTTWSTLVGRLGTDGDITPDFSSEAVFVHPWVDGGCEPAFEYDVIGWPGAVRVRAWQDGRDEGCDAYFPSVDLIWAQVGDATDLDFCTR